MNASSENSQIGLERKIYTEMNASSENNQMGLERKI